MLVNVAYRANPDPRPLLGSPARRVGAGAVPPSNGMLDTSAQYIGAFGDFELAGGMDLLRPRVRLRYAGARERGGPAVVAVA